MTESSIYESYASFVKSRAKPLETTTLNILHGCVGCATEAGEILDTAKKLWIYNQKLNEKNKEGKTHKENLEEECGDMLFYIQVILNELELDLETVIINNIAKLSRRYPNGYSDSAAKIRADKEEPTRDASSGEAASGT